MPRFAFLLSAFIFTAPVFAQEFRASIAGQVTDSTGAIVPDATIVVADVVRTAASQTLSNSAGHYLVQYLVPGRYTVTAEKTGFKKSLRPSLTLGSADHIALDFVLEVGQIKPS